MCKESETDERLLAEHLIFSEDVFEDDGASDSEKSNVRSRARKRKAEGQEGGNEKMAHRIRQ